LQFWDPNGDTFAYIGTRTTGRDAGDYALVGPGWDGVLPAGVNRIDAPYDSLALWGRIGVDGPEDLENARAIQDRVCLTPLSVFGESEAPIESDIEFSDQRVALSNPQQVDGRDCLTEAGLVGVGQSVVEVVLLVSEHVR
jgi:hypothetical protein